MHKKQNAYIGLFLCTISATLCFAVISHYQTREAPEYFPNTLAAGTCGDGDINLTETCDDGNAVSDDGCSSTCESEENWTCSGGCPLAQALSNYVTYQQIIALSSTKVMLVWSGDNNGTIKIKPGTIDGTTVTWDNAQTVNTVAAGVTGLKAVALDDNSFVIAFRTVGVGGHQTPYLMHMDDPEGDDTYEITDTQAASTFFSDTRSLELINLADDRVVVGFIYNDVPYTGILTVDNNGNLDVGTMTGQDPGSMNGRNLMRLARISDEYFIVAYETNQGLDDARYFIGRNATEISDTQVAYFAIGSQFDSNIDYMDVVGFNETEKRYMIVYNKAEDLFFKVGQVLTTTSDFLDTTRYQATDDWTGSLTSLQAVSSVDDDDSVMVTFYSTDDNTVGTIKATLNASDQPDQFTFEGAHHSTDAHVDITPLSNSAYIHLANDDPKLKYFITDGEADSCRSTCTYKPPNLEQLHFRWRDDSVGLNTDGGWLAAEDTNMSSDIESGNTYRLRFTVDNSGEGNNPNPQSFQLQFGEKKTTCDAITGSYWRNVDHLVGDDFEMLASSHYDSYDEITTNLLTIPPKNNTPSKTLWAGMGMDETPEISYNYHICNGLTPTIYVDNGIIVGGPLDGDAYVGTLEGTSGNDIIEAAGGGAAIIYGYEGRDTICGAGGDDTIYGGDGNDTITGLGGSDTIYGDAGNDTIYAAWGTLDKSYGGEGNDTIYAGSGVDHVYGEGGNDTLYGEKGLDFVDGGDGNDSGYGGQGNDTFDNLSTYNWFQGDDTTERTSRLFKGFYTEVEFTIGKRNNPSIWTSRLARNYCFRLYNEYEDSPLDEYTVFPEVTTTWCLDGVVDPGEACDDGNTQNGDGCSTTCTLEAGCGNGVLNDGEGCDDGDTDDGDGCSSTCSIESGYICSGEPSSCEVACGNGSLNDGEDCDDGNATAGDGCSDSCTIESGYSCSGEPSSCSVVCGDGLIVGSEVCDDSNVANGDGCNSDCSAVETGFTCTGAPSLCTAICGDGLKLGTEECDDSNTDDDDGCSSTCTVEEGSECGANGECNPVECGDGIVAPPEECEPPGVGLCSDMCTLKTTGGASHKEENETVRTEEEIHPELALEKIYIEECGNEVVDPGEECDFGNLNGLSSCSRDCVNLYCGDGVVTSEIGEECEPVDIDTAPYCGDGECTPYCTFTIACEDPTDQIAFEPDAPGNPFVESGIHQSAPDSVDGSSSEVTEGIKKQYDAFAVCGNGKPEGREQCDTGGVCVGGKYHNTQLINANDADRCIEGKGIPKPVSNDGCSDTCAIEKCGDGVIQKNELCDYGGQCSGTPELSCSSDFDCPTGELCVPAASNPYCSQTCMYCDGVYTIRVPITESVEGEHAVKVQVQNHCGVRSTAETSFTVLTESVATIDHYVTRNNASYESHEHLQKRNGLLPPQVSVTTDKAMYSPEDSEVLLTVLVTDDSGIPLIGLPDSAFKVALDSEIVSDMTIDSYSQGCDSSLIPTYICATQ